MLGLRVEGDDKEGKETKVSDWCYLAIFSALLIVCVWLIVRCPGGLRRDVREWKKDNDDVETRKPIANEDE